MSKKSKYRTVSIPTGITDAIKEIMDALGYWPSVGSFIREAALDKIRKERKLLKEIREAKERSEKDEPT